MFNKKEKIVIYVESINCYMIHADFKKNGKTELTIETSEGKVNVCDLTIEMDKYELKEK